MKLSLFGRRDTHPTACVRCGHEIPVAQRGPDVTLCSDICAFEDSVELELPILPPTPRDPAER
jgi:hypothetical protein